MCRGIGPLASDGDRQVHARRQRRSWRCRRAGSRCAAGRRRGRRRRRDVRQIELDATAADQRFIFRGERGRSGQCNAAGNINPTFAQIAAVTRILRANVPRGIGDSCGNLARRLRPAQAADQCCLPAHERGGHRGAAPTSHSRCLRACCGLPRPARRHPPNTRDRPRRVRRGTAPDAAGRVAR